MREDGWRRIVVPAVSRWAARHTIHSTRAGRAMQLRECARSSNQPRQLNPPMT
jgi:hypothetical protein